MIRGFHPAPRLEPGTLDRLQWGAALKGGLIAGGVLLIVPHGSPWASVTFFVPAILGRSLPENNGLALPVAWGVHLVLSLIYGVVVGESVSFFHRLQALIIGAAAGAGLYLVNLGVVSVFWPELRGGEGGVFLAHLAFGLIAGGAYRGLLNRRSNFVGRT